MRTSENLPAEPTPFEKFEELTKRLLGVSKREITEKAQRPDKTPKSPEETRTPTGR
jgi:hypothetical protein